MITENNMIYANPLAYRVFPNIGNPMNTGLVDKAVYTGHLVVTDSSGNTKNFSNTNTIDFTGFSGSVTVDQYTDTGSVSLGRWKITQSIIITNDITITVTPISEVISAGATITPQYLVKYNIYSNEELTESTIVTPDSITLLSNVEWITISNNQIVIAANTNTEARQGLVMIQVKYQEYSTSANYNIVLAGYNIVEDIKDAIVLWYDLKRQGATNESMAANPILKDFSGNGHDATCHNFAWSGMSGIGGYAYDFTTFGQGILKNCTATKFDMINESTSYAGTYNNKVWYNNKFTLRVSNFDSSAQLIVRYYYIDTENVPQMSGTILDMSGNGDYVIDGSLYENAVGIAIQFTGIGSCTIEQLPIYPNALVSDGVDDYGMVDGLPLLNKEDGYTVIAKRKTISNKVPTGLFSKRINNNYGAFVVEKDANRYYNFGFNDIITFSNGDIIYQTSKRYCDITIQSGYLSDTDFLLLLAGFLNNGVASEFKSAALYYLLLFNRDLTPDEIDWVKTNLIEGDTEL